MPNDSRPVLIRSFLTRSGFQIVPLLLLFLFTPAHAEIYKWMDKEGVQHYSERPPVGMKYEMVDPHYAAPESSSEPSVKEEQQGDKNRVDQQRIQQEQRQKADLAKIRQQNCVTAQKQLEDFQSSPRIRMQAPDGTVQRLTEEERQAKIIEAQELIKKYCD